MFKPHSTAVIITLAASIALGPLSTDMYLPSLPGLTETFNTSVDRVQITLSVFLYGFAVAQLFYGPLADRFGRKPILLAGWVCVQSGQPAGHKTVGRRQSHRERRRGLSAPDRRWY